MPPPNVFPCGQPGQPACPPEPASLTNEPAQYTYSDMQAHGFAQYQKGVADLIAAYKESQGHLGDK